MITLAFPTLAMPTALVTLPDVEAPFGLPPMRKRQNAFDTDARTVVVYDFGDSAQVFTVDLGPLSKADADAVQSFFDDPASANGRARSWQIQRSDGSIHTVKFAQDVIEQRPVGVAWFNVALTLKVIS